MTPKMKRRASADVEVIKTGEAFLASIYPLPEWLALAAASGSPRTEREIAGYVQVVRNISALVAAAKAREEIKP